MLWDLKFFSEIVLGPGQCDFNPMSCSPEASKCYSALYIAVRLYQWNSSLLLAKREVVIHGPNFAKILLSSKADSDCVHTAFCRERYTVV